MNKFIFTGLIILLFSHAVIAQKAPFKPELSFGINGGVTLSSISFNPSVQQQKLQQYVGGATVRYISERNFGLQMELNYSQRGWQEKDSVPDYKYTRSLSYLEVPICTHIYADLGKRVRLIFNLGPQLSFLLSEDIKDNHVINTPSRPNATAVDDDGERKIQYYDTDVQRMFDWGLCGGGGLEFRTGVGSIIAEGRYYFGLSDIFSNKKSDEFSSSSNQVINVKIAYLYRF